MNEDGGVTLGRGKSNSLPGSCDEFIMMQNEFLYVCLLRLSAQKQEYMSSCCLERNKGAWGALHIFLSLSELLCMNTTLEVPVLHT